MISFTKFIKDDRMISVGGHETGICISVCQKNEVDPEIKVG